MDETERKIILHYNQAEKQRLSPILLVTEALHPSLSGLLDSVLFDSPFSERLNLEGMTAFFRQVNDPEGMDITQKLSQASERYIDLRDLFYARIVDSVKRISAERPFDIRKDIEVGYEEITSRAVGRNVCEALRQSHSAYIRLSVETFRVYSKAAEMVGIDAERQKRLVPLPDALDALETAVWEHRQADLDRVYKKDSI
jgi:hypothetical protein